MRIVEIKSIDKNKNAHPFLRKFMLPQDDYEIFRFSGSTLKDEEGERRSDRKK